jgi:hypothetical protein
MFICDLCRISFTAVRPSLSWEYLYACHFRVNLKLHLFESTARDQLRKVICNKFVRNAAKIAAGMFIVALSKRMLRFLFSVEVVPQTFAHSVIHPSRPHFHTQRRFSNQRFSILTMSSPYFYIFFSLSQSSYGPYKCFGIDICKNFLHSAIN